MTSVLCVLVRKYRLMLLCVIKEQHKCFFIIDDHLPTHLRCPRAFMIDDHLPIYDSSSMLSKS